MSNTRNSLAFSFLLIAGSALVQGCANTPPTNSSDNPGTQQASMGETDATKDEGVVHHVSQADETAAHSSEKLSGTTAVLWVNGLGCPQCATNADLQLKRIPGVGNIHTDLSTGKISVTIPGGSKNPSAMRFADAITDAGFTLVKVEAN